ncbi:MAG: hypothetical protein AB7O38_14995 [Pirellulaceae bacterium]
MLDVSGAASFCAPGFCFWETWVMQAGEMQGEVFVDRRSYEPGMSPSRERRQFANSHAELTPAARELAVAIDEYKLRHRRRFITFEEMLTVIRSLGYQKSPSE